MDDGDGPVEIFHEEGELEGTGHIAKAWEAGRQPARIPLDLDFQVRLHCGLCRKDSARSCPGLAQRKVNGGTEL